MLELVTGIGGAIFQTDVSPDEQDSSLNTPKG